MKKVYILMVLVFSIMVLLLVFNKPKFNSNKTIKEKVLTNEELEAQEELVKMTNEMINNFE